jgi:hypothetical protein
VNDKSLDQMAEDDPGFEVKTVMEILDEKNKQSRDESPAAVKAREWQGVRRSR